MTKNFHSRLTFLGKGFLALLLLAGLLIPAFSQPPYKTPVITVMVDELVFPESPLWHPDGYILFSDVHASKIYKFTKEGKMTLWFDNGIKTNGLIYSKDRKKVYACDHSDKSLIEIDVKTRKYKTLAKEYQGKPFLNVNDITLAPNGTLYFTDPTWSGKTSDIQGIYSYSPKGVLKRAVELSGQPNGIAVTPDGKWLYVARSGGADLWRYSLQPDGTLSKGTCLIQLEKGSSPDGITLDSQGNIYVAQFGNNKIAIVSPKGKLIQTFDSPVKLPSNVEFDGSDERILFVTCDGPETKKEGSVLSFFFYARQDSPSK